MQKDIVKICLDHLEVGHNRGETAYGMVAGNKDGQGRRKEMKPSSHAPSAHLPDQAATPIS